MASDDDAVLAAVAELRAAQVRYDEWERKIDTARQVVEQLQSQFLGIHSSMMMARDHFNNVMMSTGG